MTADPLRQQIAREVKRALYDADMRAPEAARRMQVLTGKPAEPKTIYRWAKGEVLAPLDRLADLATAIDQPITLRLGPQTESAPPPEWAKGLTEDLRASLSAEIQTTRDVVTAALASRIAEQAALSLEPLQRQLRDALARLDGHQGE